MAFFADAALDAALSHISTNAVAIHVCTSEPAGYANVAAASLGSTGVTFTGPADASSGTGRELTVVSTAGATYGTSGTASHYVIVSAGAVLASGAFSASKAVNAGDDITIENFGLIMRDAVAL